MEIIISFFEWIIRIHRYPQKHKNELVIFWVIVSTIFYDNLPYEFGRTVILISNGLVVAYYLALFYTKLKGVNLEGPFKLIYSKLSDRLVIAIWVVSMTQIFNFIEMFLILPKAVERQMLSAIPISYFIYLLISVISIFVIWIPSPLIHKKHLRLAYKCKKEDEERYLIEFSKRDRMYYSILFEKSELPNKVKSVKGSFNLVNDLNTETVKETIEIENSKFCEYSIAIKGAVKGITDFWDKHNRHVVDMFNSLGMVEKSSREALKEGLISHMNNESIMGTIKYRLKGYYGEERLYKKMNSTGVSYFEGNTFLSDISNRTTEVDALIIADDSLHVFEVKDYSAKEIILEKSGYFYKVDYYGNEQKMETLGQVERCNSILIEILGREIPIYNYIVLSDPETKVINHFDNERLKVMHIDAIPFSLNSIKQTETTETYKNIMQRLENSLVAEKLYPAVNVTEVYNKLRFEILKLGLVLKELEKDIWNLIEFYENGNPEQIAQLCVEDMVKESKYTSVSKEFIESVKESKIRNRKKNIDYFKTILLNEEADGSLKKMRLDLESFLDNIDILHTKNYQDAMGIKVKDKGENINDR